jgi:hypothetical protein
MLPLAIGALLEGEALIQFVQYALTVAGATAVINQLKEKEKKEDQKEEKDLFSSSSSGLDFGTSKEAPESEIQNVGSESGSQSGRLQGDLFSSSSSSEDLFAALGQYVSKPVPEDVSQEVADDGASLEVSTGGSSLLEVLKNGVDVNSQGWQRLLMQLQDLKRVIEAKDLSSDMESLSQKLERLNEQLKALVVAVSSGVLVLEAIRQEGLKVSLPQEVLDSSRATKEVMDLLKTPVEVNPEEAITGGTPIEVVAKGVGVQAKTFADINSFEVDSDIPDLPGEVDLSAIFRFLRVSSQLREGS